VSNFPSVGAIIHDGRVKACRIAGVFLVDKKSATEFGKKREAQVQAEAARKARSERLDKLAKLSDEQLAGLFSGRIKNWSEVSGASQPVLLVGEPTSTPHRLIKEALGIAYAPELRVVQNTNQTAIIVAQAPGAISNISTAHDVPERSKFKVVQSELKLGLKLYLAFRKDAPDEGAGRGAPQGRTRSPAPPGTNRH